MMDAKRLYEDDVVAWAEKQAKALREAAARNSNLPIDWENVAEEPAQPKVKDRHQIGGDRRQGAPYIIGTAPG